MAGRKNTQCKRHREYKSREKGKKRGKKNNSELTGSQKLMHMRQFEMLQIFVPNLREIHLFGEK